MTDTTTPTRPDVLRALADRVERGESGEDIEREFMPLLGARAEPWDPDWIWMITLRDVVPSRIIGNVGSVTTSLDATEALRQAVLPGSWVYAIQQNARLSGLGWRWTCELITRGGEHAVLGEAPTEPAARLSALLRALAAEMEGRS